MKKLIIVLVLFCNVILLVAQEDYENPRDVIYPYDENITTIRGVKIVDIVEGNIVLYHRDDKGYQIKASSVYRNGEYIVLSNEIDYSNSTFKNTQSTKKSTNYMTDPEYLRYTALYEGAKRRMGAGGFFTIFGTAGIVAGAIMLYDDTSQNDQAAAILYLSGSLAFNIGLPLWISGGVRKRNNYNAMQKRMNELTLSFGPSSSGQGVGLNLRF